MNKNGAIRSMSRVRTSGVELDAVRRADCRHNGTQCVDVHAFKGARCASCRNRSRWGANGLNLNCGFFGSERLQQPHFCGGQSFAANRPNGRGFLRGLDALEYFQRRSRLLAALSRNGFPLRFRQRNALHVDTGMG